MKYNNDTGYVLPPAPREAPAGANNGPAAAPRRGAAVGAGHAG